MRAKSKLRLGALLSLLVACSLVKYSSIFGEYNTYSALGGVLLFFLSLHMLVLPGAYVSDHNYSSETSMKSGPHISDDSRSGSDGGAF